jgi:hypothetical protein
LLKTPELQRLSATVEVLRVGVMIVGVISVGVMTVGVLSVGVMTSRFVNPRDLIITEAGLYTVFGPVYISINRNFKTPSMIRIKSTLKCSFVCM